ncbi:permease-like cell division protein FtsX [Thiohalorhabdus methylotrophus]|uniref:Cell division protein FtsX n=1 Tax=Thiohalorhabdus methylotrophus TaxID=3242694 RepID=A0ABV4TVP0_9GAMM
MLPFTPLRQHREIFREAAANLARHPGSTLLTVLVLAAAMALPAALMLVTDNLERLTSRFDAPGTLNVFLASETDRPVADIESRLLGLDDVASVSYTPPDQALEEAARLLDLGDALGGLSENPLPGSFRVTVAAGRRGPDRLARLADSIGGWPGVDRVQYERQWVERFQASVGFLRSVGSVTALLLGGVVVLVIGNTIRLAVAARRREIEVIKMIGATDAFVRLPFLYTGLLQGALAALGACILVAVALGFLEGAIADLASQYGARFTLEGPGLRYLGALLLAGAGLGWLGSRLAVGRHLRDIEPA